MWTFVTGILHTLVFSRFIHVAACIRTSFLFIPLYGYTRNPLTSVWTFGLILHCSLLFFNFFIIIIIFCFLKIYFIYLFLLCWVFIAARVVSLVVASGGYSLLQCAGFSLRSTGSRHAGFSSCGMWAQ